MRRYLLFKRIKVFQKNDREESLLSSQKMDWEFDVKHVLQYPITITRTAPFVIQTVSLTIFFLFYFAGYFATHFSAVKKKSKGFEAWLS